MKLAQFKALLESNRNKQFLLQLPNGKTVPQAFHITEVGFVSKTFIDCGGKVHTQQTCQLQAWLGPDVDHRIEAGKMADILTKATAIIPHDFLDLEVEYEDEVISQYPVADANVTETAVTLVLTTKHTDCLAKDLCFVPAGDSCAPGSGCC
ncbi:hypothetical protein EON83_19535 [bacterium]|nr:MAG: hypothetical protein EON83_19535 [bacterium]